MIDLTPLINAFIAVLAAFLTPRIISWLVARTDAENRARMREWVKIAVAAAEQIYDAADGDKKKAYVVNFLQTHGFDVDFDSLDNAIEAAVLELHRRLYDGDFG